MQEKSETIHPRPQLSRAQWLDLGGTWGFTYDDTNCGQDEKWQEREDVFTRTIQVPFPPESAASGIGDTNFHPIVWYRRTFQVRAELRRMFLAHVLVHEIAHILQGTNGHSDTGVMKAHWTEGDYSQMRFKPLAFTSADIRLLHAGMGKRPACCST